ncbi:hypothetical protein KU6B_15360 [Mameliella alba]|uniref:hypothetical protein n=2 Tax=Mameliella alba TaxID=561184 RepID=UPI0013E49D08|nr:hypothetical protein KU6B_15360 [Mameliella alba]
MLASPRGLGHDWHMAVRFHHPLLCAAVIAALTGCTQFPELDARQTPGVADAPYPDLLPLDALLNGAVPRATPGEAAVVEGRVAALKARASRLQRVDIAPRGVDGRLARLRQKAAALRAK